MRVHPDVMEGQQWTTVINKKSKGKARASPCNVVCAFSRKAETDVASLTNSEETIALAAEPNAPLVAGASSGQSYLKKYDEVVENPPKSTQEPTKQFRSNLWRNKRSSGMPKLSQKTKRRDLWHLTALMF